jgi:hypothetical protein
VYTYSSVSDPDPHSIGRLTEFLLLEYYRDPDPHSFSKLDRDPDTVRIHLKMWIRIRIKSMRIQNTVYSTYSTSNPLADNPLELFDKRIILVLVT